MHLQPLSRKRNKDKNHLSQFFFCVRYLSIKQNRIAVHLVYIALSIVLCIFVSYNKICSIRKPRRVFRLLTSDFRFPTFDFQVPTSHFQLPTSKAQLPLDLPRGSRSRLSRKSGCTVLARGDPGRSSHKRERLKLLL